MQPASCLAWFSALLFPDGLKPHTRFAWLARYVYETNPEFSSAFSNDCPWLPMTAPYLKPPALATLSFHAWLAYALQVWYTNSNIKLSKLHLFLTVVHNGFSHLRKNHKSKTRFLTVQRGYHGDTFGAMSVCDPVRGMHSLFKGVLAEHIFANPPRRCADSRHGVEIFPLMVGVIQTWGISCTWLCVCFTSCQRPFQSGTVPLQFGGVDLWQQLFDCDAKDWADGFEDDGFSGPGSIEDALHRHHDTIAAVIIEPVVQGAGGMRIYHPEYLRKLRKLCDELDVLLIFDETLGKMFEVILRSSGRSCSMFFVELTFDASFFRLKITFIYIKI